MEIIPNYPLNWPFGWPRTKKPTWSRFGKGNSKPSTFAAAEFIKEEIRRLGGSGLVITTNLKYRHDGLPYSNQAEPADKGVAVYFKYNSQDMVIAADTFDKIGCNLYAIAKTIECMRAIERYGCSELMNRAFTGFKALPPPGYAGASSASATGGPEPPKRQWFEVLEVSEQADLDIIKAAYYVHAKNRHPDSPTGSEAAFKELNEAYEFIRKNRPVAANNSSHAI